MEYDDLLITTGVDALVRLVKEKKKIELEEAAQKLNIPHDTVEEWAHVLEEEGVVKIEYRLTKQYLLWINPTKEDIEEENVKFKDNKRKIETESDLASQRIKQQISGMEELKKMFESFYTKAAPKMEQLEKIVMAIPSAKDESKKTEEYFKKQEDAISKSEEELANLRESLNEIKTDLEKINIKSASDESKVTLETADKVTNELKHMQTELKELLKKASSTTSEELKLPDIKDIKSKFEMLKKEFTTLRSKNAQLRADTISLQESSEILKGVSESVSSHQNSFQQMKKDMEELNSQANSLESKVNSIVSKIREHKDLAERLGDSVTVAKGLLERFPSQEKLKKEVESLNDSEEQVVEKLNALEKLLEVVGGKNVVAKQFAELGKKIEEKTYQLRQDLDALASSLEDEKSTYLTFQKIKDRLVPAVENYEKEMHTIEARLGTMDHEIDKQKEKLTAEALKIQQMLGGEQMQSVVKISDEIRDKKKVLDQMYQAMGELYESAESLNKKVTLLSKQAKMIEIRKDSNGNESPSKEMEKLQKELKVTADEEEEFKKKRKEVADLIKKLWD